MKKVLFIHNSSNEADRQLVEKLGFNTQSLCTIGVDFVKKGDMQIWAIAGVERYRTIPQSYLKNADLLVFSPNISVRNAEEYAKSNSVPCLYLQENDLILSKEQLIESMKETMNPLLIQQKLSNLLLQKSYQAKTLHGESSKKYYAPIVNNVLPFLTLEDVDAKMLQEFKEKTCKILRSSPANDVEQKLTNLLQFIHSNTASPEEGNSQLSTYTYPIQYDNKTYNIPWSVMHAYDSKITGKYNSERVINGLKADLAKSNASEIIAEKLLSPMYGVLWNSKYGVSEAYLETLKSPNELYKKIKYTDKADKQESHDPNFRMFAGNNEIRNCNTDVNIS